MIFGGLTWRSGSCGSWAEVEHARSCPPQIGLFGVGHVDEGLGSGDVVDGGDASVLDAEVFLDDLHDGGEAVGGAGCVGDDLVLGREELMVASEDDIEHAGLLDGSRYDNTLDATFFRVGLEGVDFEELPGTFEDHVNAHGLEIDLGVVLLLGERDLLAVHEEATIGVLLNVLVPGAVDRVILGEVCGRLDGAKVVDVDDFHGWVIPCVSEDETPNTTESVDGYFDFLGSKHLVSV